MSNNSPLVRRALHLAYGRWADILPSLCPDLDEACSQPGRHVACPIHGGSNGFRVFEDFNQVGGSVCNTCSDRPFRDGIETLAWSNNWTPEQAAEQVLKLIGDPKPTRRKSSPSRITSARPFKPTNLRTANDHASDELLTLWSQARVVTRQTSLSPTGRYLSKRTCKDVVTLLDSQGDQCGVRHLNPCKQTYRGVNNKPGQRWHAMLARFDSPQGNLVATLTTLLSAEGCKAPTSKVGEAKVMSRKELNGRLDGASVRIIDDLGHRVLFIAEGIETAISLALAFRFADVYATGTAGMLAKFELPTNRRLAHDLSIIAIDNDISGTGQRAGAALAERLAAESTALVCLVTPSMPEDIAVAVRESDVPLPGWAVKGPDWNDIFAEAAVDEVRWQITNQVVEQLGESLAESFGFSFSSFMSESTDGMAS